MQTTVATSSPELSASRSVPLPPTPYAFHLFLLAREIQVWSKSIVMHCPSAIRTIAFASLLLTCAAAAADDARLKVARQNYDKQLKTINDNSVRRTSGWPAKYKAQLTSLQNTFQGSGDLDGLIAVRHELNRFDRAAAIPEDSVVTAPAELAALQKTYLAVASQKDPIKNKEIVDLVGKYVAHLERLKMALTKTGDVASALAAKSEIERVNASALVVAAQKGVSASEAKPAAAGAKPAAAEKVAKPTAPAGYTVYPPGATPPRVTGEVFTRLALKVTGNTRLADRKVSVVASRCTEANVSRTSSYYSSKRTTKTSTVRLRVRYYRTSGEAKDKIVNVQFFNRRLGSRGSVTPTLAGSGDIVLPSLTSQGVYIDCPDLTASSSLSSYGGQSGTQFLGILVSVYNSDGTLSYQGMSSATLKTVAASAKVRTAAPTTTRTAGGVRRVTRPPAIDAPVVDNEHHDLALAAKAQTGEATQANFAEAIHATGDDYKETILRSTCTIFWPKKSGGILVGVSKTAGAVFFLSTYTPEVLAKAQAIYKASGRSDIVITYAITKDSRKIVFEITESE